MAAAASQAAAVENAEWHVPPSPVWLQRMSPRWCGPASRRSCTAPRPPAATRRPAHELRLCAGPTFAPPAPPRATTLPHRTQRLTRDGHASPPTCCLIHRARHPSPAGDVRRSRPAQPSPRSAGGAGSGPSGGSRPARARSWWSRPTLCSVPSANLCACVGVVRAMTRRVTAVEGSAARKVRGTRAGQPSANEPVGGQDVLQRSPKGRHQLVAPQLLVQLVPAQDTAAGRAAL